MVVPEDTRAPILVETLRDLEILVQQDPQDHLIVMRGLSELREARSAVTMIAALCSDHGWKLVGGMDYVSNAAELDKELEAVEAVTLPRLALELEDEDGQVRPIPDQRNAMESVLEQVQGVREMAVNLGPSLVSAVDPLLSLVNQVYNNPPITDMHIEEISSLLEDIRSTSIRLDEAQEKRVRSAVDALISDIHNSEMEFKLEVQAMRSSLKVEAESIHSMLKLQADSLAHLEAEAMRSSLKVEAEAIHSILKLQADSQAHLDDLVRGLSNGQDEDAGVEASGSDP